MAIDVTVFFVYLLSFLDSTQRNEQQASTCTPPKKRGWKVLRKYTMS